jgi:hypothetical protein
VRRVYTGLTGCLPRVYPARYACEVGCFGQGEQDSWSIGGKQRNAGGGSGPKRRFPLKALESQPGLDSPPVAKGPAATGNGGALKKPTMSIFLAMLMSSLMSAQKASSRATAGTTTTRSNGACTRTSSTSTGTSTSSASQRTRRLSTPGMLSTGSKAAAVSEAIHRVRASQSPSASTSTSSGVLLPNTVVPFR